MSAAKRRSAVLQKRYWSTADVAALLGFEREDGKPDADKARYWLQREGAAVKRGGHWYTTESRLRATFPEAFEGLAR